MTDTDRLALQGAVRELLGDLCSEAQVRAAIGTGGGFDATLWKRLGSMGVLELAGAGFRAEVEASHQDLATVFEELGRAIAPVPALSAAVALAALDHSGVPQLERWVADLGSAGRRVAIAIAVREDLATPAAPVEVRAGSDGPRLRGALLAVPEAAGADGLLVLANSPSGPALYLLDATGFEAVAVASLDLTRGAADVLLDDTPAVLVAEGVAVARVLRLAWLLLAAEQVGVAARALDAAVAYAMMRTQFGRPIGSFQAIKHGCVDMLIAVEGARQLVADAALALDAAEGDDEPGQATQRDSEAALAVSLAAAYAGEAAVDCTHRCLQIHGGIGFTWEHGVHLGLRKAKADSVLFADATAHWQRVTDELARHGAVAGGHRTVPA